MTAALTWRCAQADVARLVRVVSQGEQSLRGAGKLPWRQEAGEGAHGILTDLTLGELSHNLNRNHLFIPNWQRCHLPH